MSRTRTLTNLIADVRQRTNMETETDYVTDAEITEYLNQELAELYTHLVSAEGQPHFRSSTPINVTAGISLYALPSDFWRIQEVVASLDGVFRTLEPFMSGERSELANTQLLSAHLVNGPRYRIQADNLEFLPSTRTFTATLFYTRNSPRLVAGSDTVDGFNGYEVAAIYGTCATIMRKDDADPSFWSMQKDKIYRHIDAMAAHRDASHPERVMDVTGDLRMGRHGWYP